MTTIKLKNGSGAPTAGDLAQGEPALDLTNKRLYTEDSGGTVIEVGTNPGVDVTFADDRKAIFGAGSDLQIYHDPSAGSIIQEAGAGSLFVRASTNIQLEGVNGENMAIFNENGAVDLYYDNSKKLATTATGIDVTGTAVADGLTVQGASDSTLLVEATGGNDASLFLTEAGTGNVGAQFVYDGGDNELYLKVGNNTDINRLSVSRDTGDISFYEDTGTTAKLFWDSSAESLNLGTTSLTTLGTFVVQQSADSKGIALIDSAAANTFFIENQGDEVKFRLNATSPFTFTHNSSERMRIDSSGTVLIGKTSADNETQGVRIYPTGRQSIVSEADTALLINRRTSDGELVSFRKDATPIGNIGTASSRLYIGTDDTGLRFTNDEITPFNPSVSADRNGTVDLGGSSTRFKDLYLSGGAYLGGTAAANHLDDYEEGTWTGAVADAASGGNESSTGVSGTYVKIGKIVYLQFNASNIDTTGMTSGSDIHITGLPFTAASLGGNAKFTGTAHLSVVTFGDSPFINLSESQTYVKLGENRPSAGVDFVVVSQLSSGASDIHGNLVYQTT